MWEYDIIFVSDIHSRFDKPACMDDPDAMKKAMEVKFAALRLEKGKGKTIICAGDVFDKSENKSELVYWMLLNSPNMHAIAGNHDLPYHDINRIHQSSLGILLATKHFRRLGYLQHKGRNCSIYGYSFKEEIKKDINPETYNIAVIHKLCLNNNTDLSKFNSDAISAEKLLDDYPAYKMFIVGDNHEHFIYSKKNRHVINVGSMFRMSSNQKDYQPGYIQFNSETKEFKRVLFDNKFDVVSDTYIADNQRKEFVIDEFIKSLNSSNLEDFDCDFINNMLDYLKQADESKGVREKINKYIL